MQTWLPYADFEQSAGVLDYRRLGKQRVEAYQIYQSLLLGSGWSKHPATLMWEGHLPRLAQYGLVMSLEWVSRGYNGQIMLDRFSRLYNEYEAAACPFPSWFGNELLHASHRGRLLAKDLKFYSQFAWIDVPCDAVLYPRDLPRSKSTGTLTGYGGSSGCRLTP